MSSSKRSGLALATASAIALLAAPALAQTYVDKTGAYASPYDDDVIVVAPGVHRERTERRTYSGIPVDTLVAQRVVDTSDLDLRSNGDVRELRARIEDAAAEACDDIDASTAEPIITTRRECIRDAERDAMAQADDLIWSARG